MLWEVIFGEISENCDGLFGLTALAGTMKKLGFPAEYGVS
jgi:hypothetical protein